MKPKYLPALVEMQAKHRRPCKVCGAGLSDIVDEILEEIMAARDIPTIGLRTVYDFLREKKGYGGTARSLAYHLEFHRPEIKARWDKARAAPKRVP